jgi:hypothetical protein
MAAWGSLIVVVGGRTAPCAMHNLIGNANTNSDVCPEIGAYGRARGSAERCCCAVPVLVAGARSVKANERPDDRVNDHLCNGSEIIYICDVQIALVM